MSNKMGVDFQNDLILVTAASGKQGRGLLPFVSKTWKRLRLQCVSDKSKQSLQECYPNAEVIQSDFADLASAKKLLQGVAICVLVTPAFHPRETQYGLHMIDAAIQSFQSGGPLKHMVLSSVLHPCIRALANHDSKRFVEEALIESDLPYTIVQPSHVMDNVPIAAIAKQESPVFPARFDPATKFSFTTTHDLGEAVANILKDREKHMYAVYPLVSTSQPLSYYEAMEIVSSVIGKKVGIQRLSLEENVRQFDKTVTESMNEGDRAAIMRAFKRLMAYYDSKGLVGNSNVMEYVLGRKPLDYRAWVEMQLQQK